MSPGPLCATVRDVAVVYGKNQLVQYFILIVIPP